MDKKKVKIHVEDAIAFLDKLSNYVNGYNNNVYLCNAIKALDMAKAELSKSDWISVEDRLPEFGEKVYVRSERSPDLIQTCREDFDEEDGKIHPFRNKDKFVLEHGIYGNITHWKPIETLEK